MEFIKVDDLWLNAKQILYVEDRADDDCVRVHWNASNQWGLMQIEEFYGERAQLLRAYLAMVSSGVSYWKVDKTASE